ncbi:Hypothetical protein R9X50_00736900 [Acrodontium crateriforme]|uniref:Hemerythrin-like domain-containing protein n=1 Tax=Acrodontium crateriforme TaxID=150365 RepID=A0AAQ3MCC1_9PEZI|nr:Hypothetical protein R9X50_00736900 [Acrodontium crateriforme]
MLRASLRNPILLISSVSAPLSSSSLSYPVFGRRIAIVAIISPAAPRVYNSLYTMTESKAEASKAGGKMEDQQKAAPATLPKLSAQDFRVYNRMADRMNNFHENFRRTWEFIYKACETGKRPLGMSIRAFLTTGADFCQHLTLHHGIEERQIYPILARKMPAFKKELELLTQHKHIHHGLDRFEKYINECRSGERELRLDEMKAVMDTFGTVLWEHLDDEVRELGAEKMRLYWTVEEMRRMPM